MFQLTANEFENLRCKNFTSSWGGPRYLPNAFMEQGIYMLMIVFVIVVCLFLFFLHIVFLLSVAHKKTLDFTSTALRKAYITVSSVIYILNFQILIV